VYTAHSIPVEMARNCRYVEQLRGTCRKISAALGRADDPLVYQSRSGRPGQPWLGPDILEYLRQTAAAAGSRQIVIAPVGFVSDHLEVIYDLDVEAKALCDELNLSMTRAATVGVHPAFVRMIRELVLERMSNDSAGRDPSGAQGELCDADCCLPG
ncbi:MAG: ferrochelatase, partial [Terriglobia bacterium]